jgi:transketolase
MGTVFVQGTSTTSNLVRILPDLDREGLNVKVVAAISPQLFALQDKAYQENVASVADRWNAMCISNRCLRVTQDWICNPVVAEYSMTSDWDNRWRTGGSVDEVIAEAHLSPEDILKGIERFARDKKDRLRRLREAVEAADYN